MANPMDVINTTVDVASKVSNAPKTTADAAAGLTKSILPSDLSPAVDIANTAFGGSTLVQNAVNKVIPPVKIPNVTSNTTLPTMNDLINKVPAKYREAGRAINAAYGDKIREKLGLPASMKKVFNQRSSIAESGFSKTLHGGVANSYGYRGDVDSKTDGRVLVKIVANKANGTGSDDVTALLQNTIDFRTTSEWQPLLAGLDLGGGGQIGALTELFSQAALKRSLKNVFSSRRIWHGTTPIELKLDLFFIAYNNAIEEVLVPCKLLQKWILPSYGEDKEDTSTAEGWGRAINEVGIPLLKAPGPDPFKGIDWTAGGTSIDVFIGNFMTMNGVVLRDLSISFDNKMSSDGVPMSAKVSVSIETYEILTKEKVDGLYTGNMKQ